MLRLMLWWALVELPLLSTSDANPVSTVEFFPMLCCPHPWTMSMLNGDSRNQRPRNLGNLQGILQQVLGSRD